MRKTALALTVLFIPVAAEAEDVPQPAIQTIATALEKGHGTYCDLRSVPNTADGYYRCLDFGPYRYVEKYGTSELFVIQKGHLPYIIAKGQPDSMKWIEFGPWTNDVQYRANVWASQNLSKPDTDSANKENLDAGRVARQYIESLRPATKGRQKEKLAADPISPPSTQSETNEIPNDIKELLRK